MAEILLKFSFAVESGHFYHFIGPFVDSQQSTYMSQNLKAFRRDEFKKQNTDVEEPTKHRNITLF